MFAKLFLDSLPLTNEALSQLTDTPLPPTDGMDLPSGDYGFAIIKLFLSLIVVAGLLGLTIWFLRRLIRYKLEKGGTAQAIKVLEKKMISPKTMLYFVEIEGKKIILAESQLEVRQLTVTPNTEYGK
jgi:flagellar biogenesis protein FliO